jgi:two-component system, NarL family, nitrate/nitrite response regulator NarL
MSKSSNPFGVLVAESGEGIDPQRVLALSADACIFNLSSRDALIKALELTLLDQRVVVFPKSIATTADFTDPPRVSQSDAPSRPLEINGHGLSPRESEVLTSLAEGKSNKLIARVCHISEATVKVHLKAILRKTKAHNRTQAAIWAIQHGYRDHLSLENRPIIADARKSQPINGASPLQSVAA